MVLAENEEASEEKKEKGAYSLDDAMKFLEGGSTSKEEGSSDTPSDSEGSDPEEGENSQTPIPKPQYLVGTEEEASGDATDVVLFIQKIANAITGVVATVAVLFIVINGAMMVISAGDSDKISNAKKGLTWGAIGLLLIMFAYIIVRTIIAVSYTGQSEAGSSEESGGGTQNQQSEASNT